jgi:hypothetical protein
VCAFPPVESPPGQEQGGCGRGSGDGLPPRGDAAEQPLQQGLVRSLQQRWCSRRRHVSGAQGYWGAGRSCSGVEKASSWSRVERALGDRSTKLQTDRETMTLVGLVRLAAVYASVIAARELCHAKAMCLRVGECNNMNISVYVRNWLQLCIIQLSVDTACTVSLIDH